MQLDLAFDAEAHEYKLSGVRIPSVTQVLSFGQDLSRIPRWTAERGTAFHLATEYDDAGDLDEESVDALVRPHLEAYRKWKAATRPRFMATEFRIWGEIDGLKYAGTIDRVIESPTPFNPLIADLKSGAPRKEHGAQLWAYAVAYHQQVHEREDVGSRNPRAVPYVKGVYCLKDGTFSEKPYDGREHLEAFRVKLHQWYEANIAGRKDGI